MILMLRMAEFPKWHENDEMHNCFFLGGACKDCVDNVL
jgi:hypothetical protein